MSVLGTAADRACAVMLVTALACHPRDQPTRLAPLPRGALLTDLVGTWRWTLRTQEGGTTRIEAETWRFRPVDGAPNRLVGRYVREVEVRSDDRVPFGCNQRPWYRQRATFELAVEPTRNGFAVRETDYRAEPGPCDHGFRKIGAYTGTLDGNRLQLHWDGGVERLWHVDAAVAELPAPPWPAEPPLAGPWRWDATSYDDAGNLRDESEWWELTRRGADRLDATYRRRVTVRSPDGANIACAGAPSWTFDDGYVLDGQREEEHWHFYERAADPGSHPCLAPTPKRSLDEATAEQIGDYLILEWRGKRHQVLYRPD
ncbi:MAG TPA: hypothetical protein VGC42_29300 [Kofleriaceae bacterium]